MTSESEAKHFIYHTQGVCPPEIHFCLRAGILESARFVGGGCTGNAQLVARLLSGTPVEEVMEILEGIDCRNDTSCPHQLGVAIQSALDGSLKPADSFRVFQDTQPRDVIALIGDLSGNGAALEALLAHIHAKGIETIYCLGNLTGNGGENSDLIRILQKKKIPAVQGERDWRVAEGNENARPVLPPKEMDWLLRVPQALSFRINEKQGFCFFGRFIQELPGYSDFEPYALEMNMVGGLTDFMRDETVFPALEAMVPQFQAQIIIFGQTRQWGHWQVAETDIIGVGPASDEGGLSWGILEADGETVRFEIMRI